jgi:DNA primase
MTNWINIKELRKQLDFDEVLRYYGVLLKLTGDQHHGFCPLPSHDGKRNSPSFSANLERGIWQCFGCGKKGNVLDFAVLMERGDPKNGKDVQRVALQLKERFVGGKQPTETSDEPATGEISPLSEEEEVLVNAPLDFELKGLDATHPYLFDRDFTKETIAQFGLGYCSRGLLANRIAIPLHNADGRLIGYAGRLVNDLEILEDNPKYKFPGRRKRKGVIHDFRKSLLLYNAHRIVAPVDDLAVVEGFASVWWLTQAGIKNVVAVMGASCSEEQAEALASLISRRGHLWVFTDGDTAGWRCAESILTQVAPRRFVRWVRYIGSVQATNFAPSALKDLFPFAVR